MSKRHYSLKPVCYLILTSTTFNISANELPDLFAMSFEELARNKVGNTITFTPTAPRSEPASVTTITQEMMEMAGARNLFELLEVYVPGFHYIYHHWEAAHMGLRGINSDRDDKYLLLVNGRIMNERTHFGALSERDLPMMADIRQIDIVRGPGSVIHGPGAISMVINIQTEDHRNFNGTSAIVKAGALEEFASIELKNGTTFREGHGLYWYAGISDYHGADQSDSPVFYGHTDTTTFGDSIIAGAESNLPHPNDKASHRDLPKVKLFANYDLDLLNTWVRYTRGGEKMVWSPKLLTPSPDGFRSDGTPLTASTPHSVGYQQLTLNISYKQIIGESDDLYLTHQFSFDSFDYERILFANGSDNPTNDNHREDEYLLKSLPELET